MIKPDLYFVSETVPGNTHASSVIFYRHFKRLEAEGYKITWVTDVNSYLDFKSDFPAEWAYLLLPNRNWNLPPYRPSGILQAYRFRYYYGLLAQKINPDPARSILITYINGQFLAPFAAYLSRKSRMRLISFFHDDILELNFFRNKKSLIQNTNKIMAASDRVLIASGELAARWHQFHYKFVLLYPIPAPFIGVAVSARPDQEITVGYAGAVYDEIVPSLGLVAQAAQELGFKLLIIGETAKTRHLEQRFPGVVTCRELFRTPDESNSFLAEHCQALLIAYPAHLKEMPWIATCFPSKFLQYCQLGLPTFIIAPKDAAIGKWCIAQDWPFYAENYRIEQLQKLKNRLDDPAWPSKVNALKHQDFNPDVIHKQLVAVIERTKKNA